MKHSSESNVTNTPIIEILPVRSRSRGRYCSPGAPTTSGEPSDVETDDAVDDEQGIVVESVLTFAGALPQTVQRFFLAAPELGRDDLDGGLRAR
jgi:hypothetical protein